MTDFWASDPVASPAPSGGNFWDADPVAQQAPVTAGGLATQGGVGLAKGAIGSAGMFGDARAFGNSLIDKYISNPTAAGVLKGANTALQAAAFPPSLMTSGDIQKGVEGITGAFRQPQNTAEQYAQTLGEFAPAAVGGEGSVAARALKQAVVPALASETAGQATQGTAAEPYARLAASILSPMAADRAVAAVSPKAPLATIDQVKAAATQGYQDPAITGVQLKPDAIGNLSDSIAGNLNRQRINDRLAPGTHALLDEMKTPVNGPVHTIEDLETTRQRLGDLAGNFNNPVEQKAATQAIKGLDTYSANIPQSHLLAGDADAANAALTNARANYASAKTAEKVQEKLNNADLRAASTYSGGNLNNATRQNLRALLTNPKQGRGLTPDELQTIEDTVRGSTAGNALRATGKLLGGGGGLGAMATGAVGHSLAGPIGMMAPVAGYAAKKIGDAITRANSQKIVDQILARSPVGLANAALAGGNPADRLLAIRRLLLANAATIPFRSQIGQLSQ